MTIAATISQILYTGNATTTQWSFANKIFSPTDLSVTIFDNIGGIWPFSNTTFQVTVGGVVYTYSLQNVDVDSGCIVTVTPAIPSTYKLDIRSNIPELQSTSVKNQASFYPELHEEFFDRATRMLQDLFRKAITFGIHGPDNENIPWTQLPIASQRANLTQMYDSNGLPVLGTPVTQSLTQSLIGQFLYPQTNPGEATIGLVPTNYYLPPQTVLRYGVNTTPGTTDLNAAIQGAIDSATAISPSVTWGNDIATSKPLLLRSTSQENLSFIGSARVAAALFPTATSIAQSPQNINCLMFNQNNNLHLHLNQFEFSSTVGFTGVCIYSLNGGGSDGSGKTLFSAVIRDCWMGMPTTNAGFFQGTMQNCKVNTMEFEGCAIAAFRLSGIGNQDLFFSDIAGVSNFDQFILQTDDANGAINITVNGLHWYAHNRGPLFNVQNWLACTLNNIDLQVASGATGNTGIGFFNNCTALKINNFNAVPVGAYIQCLIGMEFNGTTSAKVSNGQVSASNYGVQLDGSGVYDLDFENVDFSVFGVAALINLGSATGLIRTRNCRFNNSQASLILHNTTANFDWYSYNDEFLNAGLGAAASARNLNLAPSSTNVCNLYNPRIGQNNGSAAAAYFVQNAGAGAVNIYNPKWIGAPPTGYINNTSTGTISVSVTPGYAGTVASAAALTLPVDGDSINVSGVTGITSITASTFNFPGRRMSLIFTGILTVTSGGNLKLNGNYTTAANSVLTLVYDGSNWNEIGRG